MYSRISSIVVILLLVMGVGGNAFLAAPIAAQSGQTEFFVSPGGDDRSDGSEGSPWRTIRHAVAQLQPGSTLYVRGGLYTGSENTIDTQLGRVPSGTSWSMPITIAAYPSESVTIQPPNGLPGIRLTNSYYSGPPSYLIFQNFQLDMSNQTISAHDNGPDGVYVGNGANHNRFQGLEVMNNSGNGFMFSATNGNSPFNEVINCAIHNNGRYPGENRGYGLYVFSSDNLFEGNDIYDNNGYGMSVYNNGGMPVSRNVIRNNRIHHNGGQGGPNYAIVVAWGDGNVISGNDIFANRGGILVYTNSTNTEVDGNNLHGNGPLEGILIQWASNTAVRYNNISGPGIVDLGTNTWFEGNSGSGAGH